MKNIHKIYDQKDRDHTSCILLYSKPLNRAKFLGPKCLHTTNGVTLVNEQIKEINKTFEEKDIVICSGFEWQKIYKENIDGVRLVDNHNFENTSDIEEVKLGILNCPNSNNFLFLTDDFSIKKNNLVKMYDSSSLVISREIDFEYKLLLNDGNFNRIGFSGNCSFTGAFSLSGNELSLGIKFLLTEYKQNKVLIEMLNYILDNGGKFNLIDKVL